MTTKPRLTLNGFVLLVVVGAAGGLVFDALVTRTRPLLGPQPLILALFGVSCLVTELHPLRWLRREEGGQVTSSWTFMMASLLVGPPLAAVGIAALAMLSGELASRNQAIRAVFNFSQIIVTMSAGAAVLVLTDQDRALQPHGAIAIAWLPAFLAASAVVFVVNNALTCTVMALHQGVPISQTIRGFGAVNLSTDGVLLSLSPVFVVVAEKSLLLVPLLMVTTWTVYRMAELAIVRRHEANHDPLTHLPNRRFFDEHLHNAVVSAERSHQKVGLVLIDLNGFKGINDRLGHDVGDRVLRDVAARMNSVRRSPDMLARIGGDEFALVLTHLDSVEAARVVADRVWDSFNEPCTVKGFPVSVAASLGIAVLPDHAESPETLMRRADEAMYSAKQGEKRVAVYEPKPDSPSVGRISLLSDVAGGLAANQFFLEYQPQVNLRSGRVVGAEALVRWRHPIAGVLPPSEFIGLAEQTELIGALTERVLKEAFAQGARWHEDGHPIRVAINISARNMHDLRFPDLVARLLEDTLCPPGQVDLEITEYTVGLDRETIHSVLTRLHQMGVSLSIDDFGTGYSSMAQLRELPVDRIKIDRSFVTNMVSDERNAFIVSAIVRLAQALGIEAIAEGVESPDVAGMLDAIGCSTAQGFLFGRPTTAALLSGELALGSQLHDGRPKPSGQPELERAS
jgi:diguanylate cyclase (GGDEF)-like protein